MRKNVTFLLLLMSLALVAQPGSGVISVNVEDGCGHTFTGPVMIELFQITGNTAVKISEATSNPARFNDLGTAATYQVSISSPEQQKTDLSVKDAYAMREIILGYKNGNIASTFVGDFNGNSGVSTLDLVMMQRDLIKITNGAYRRWIFVDQARINANILSGDYLNKTTVIGLPNDRVDITFNGYKHGAVFSTLPEYCVTCDADSTASLVLHIPDIDVEAGKEVEFSLHFSSKKNYAGMLFSLLYKDAVVSKITPANGILLNQVDTISTVHMVGIPDNLTFPSYFEVAKIKCTPQRSGKLASFFEFNDQFKKEFVYKEGSCLKHYYEVKMESSSICNITWPLDITIPDCLNNYNTGLPLLDPTCVNIVSFSYVDQVIGNPCQKIIRTWTLLNWVTSELFKHTQIITIDQNYHTQCYDVTVVVTNSVIIYAQDLIKNPVSGHVYAFSPTDATRTSMTLTNELPYVITVPVYDLTDNSYCYSKVTKVTSNCNDPIRVINTVSVTAENGLYLVKGEMFDGGNQNHCRGRISDFEFKLPPSGNFGSQSFFDYEQYKGTFKSVDLRYKINGAWVSHGKVTVHFLPGNMFPPFELSCFDDPVTKNVIHEIAFFSPTFENIYALQGAIRVKDALVLSTRKVALGDIKFNEALRSIKFTWFQPSATQLTLRDTDTLFTMTILPTDSGSLSDILSIADDLLPSEAVLNDFDQTKINLVFKFLRRPSSTSQRNDDHVFIYPNPTKSGDFVIQSSVFNNAAISIINENGQLVHSTVQDAEDGLFEVSMPSDVKNGIYFVRIAHEQSFSMKKIMVLKQ